MNGTQLAKCGFKHLSKPLTTALGVNRGLPCGHKFRQPRHHKPKFGYALAHRASEPSHLVSGRQSGDRINGRHLRPFEGWYEAPLRKDDPDRFPCAVAIVIFTKFPFQVPSGGLYSGFRHRIVLMEDLHCNVHSSNVLALQCLVNKVRKNRLRVVRFAESVATQDALEVLPHLCLRRWLGRRNHLRLRN